MRSDILTIRARVEKRVNLLLQHAVLDGVEELLRLRERQTQMLNASVVFLQGDDIGDGFFLAIIIINNELKFDAHGACSSSSGGGGMASIMASATPSCFCTTQKHLEVKRSRSSMA